MAKTGCCGSLIRVIIGIINGLFLLIGLAIFIIAAILRWSSDSLLNKITNNASIESIINVAVLDAATIVLLAIGAFILLLSFIGLLGVICANRFFLVIYEIVIIMLFLAHGITLIVAALKSSDIEDEFRKALNRTIDDINNPLTENSTVTADCAALNLLSEIFECCGAQGPSDFINPEYRYECCYSNLTTDGCANKTVNTLKENGVNIIIIPNCSILAVEFLIILMVPFLIGRISRRKAQSEEEERIINVKPTTHYEYRYKNNNNYRYSS
jgi:hypothetical protein